MQLSTKTAVLQTSRLTSRTLVSHCCAEGIRATLAAGGDTDTNACIVGGALGTLWGSAGIPAHMAQPVLQYKHPAPGRWPGHARPELLQGARIPELAAALVRAGE